MTIAMTVIVSAPALASAAGLVQIVPSDCNNAGGCASICDIAQFAQNMLTDAIYLAVFFSAIAFVYAGFLSATAGGDAGKFKKAKQVFGNVVIGLVVILAAYLVVDTVMRTLVGAPLIPWGSVCNL